MIYSYDNLYVGNTYSHTTVQPVSSLRESLPAKFRFIAYVHCESVFVDYAE